jgi:hypothetical protein
VEQGILDMTNLQLLIEKAVHRFLLLFPALGKSPLKLVFHLQSQHLEFSAEISLSLHPFFEQIFDSSLRFLKNLSQLQKLFRNRDLGLILLSFELLFVLRTVARNSEVRRPCYIWL